MKVQVLQKFYDKKEGQMREVGDVFICSKTRYQEIVKGLKDYSDKPFIQEVE